MSKTAITRPNPRAAGRASVFSQAIDVGVSSNQRSGRAGTLATGQAGPGGHCVGPTVRFPAAPRGSQGGRKKEPTTPRAPARTPRCMATSSRRMGIYHCYFKQPFPRLYDDRGGLHPLLGASCRDHDFVVIRAREEVSESRSLRQHISHRRRFLPGHRPAAINPLFSAWTRPVFRPRAREDRSATYTRRNDLRPTQEGSREHAVGQELPTLASSTSRPIPRSA